MKKANIIIVAIVVFENTNLHVFAKISPSPTTNPVIVHADMILLRQIPLPAEAPTTWRASILVLLTPIDWAAITWIVPNLKQSKRKENSTTTIEYRKWHASAFLPSLSGCYTSYLYHFTHVRFETVVDPEKKEPRAPSKGEMTTKPCLNHAANIVPRI